MIRRVCVAVGMLGLFLQGTQGGHMLLVGHSQCAEHGERVHGGDAHRSVTTRHAHLHADSAVVRGTPDPSEDGEHEHCAQGADRRIAAVGVAAAVAIPTPVDTSPDFVAQDPLVTGAARFRIAPKHSPPA